MNKELKTKRITSIFLVIVYALFMIFASSSLIPQAFADNSSNSSNQTNGSIDFDNDGYNITVDCDDNNATIFTNVTGFADLDSDSFTTVNATIMCTNGSLPINYFVNISGPDCDDSSAATYPGSLEILYNQNDDDCDASTSDNLSLIILGDNTNLAIGEELEYTLIGNDGADISISLDTPNNYYNYQANYLNQTSPIIDSTGNLLKIGSYTLIGSIY